MEDKIKVGEYVRTNDGNIFKFGGYFKCKNIDSMTDEDGILYGNQQKYCKNHSKDIIDLLEVGDIIVYFSNSLGIYIKCEVNYICPKQEDYKSGEGYISTVLDDLIRIEDIKSIVTKEQFASIKYEINN